MNEYEKNVYANLFEYPTKHIVKLELENEEKDNQIKHLQNLIDKTTNYYLKTLAKNKSMPDEAVEMFNLLEENKKII